MPFAKNLESTGLFITDEKNVLTIDSEAVPIC